MTDPFAIPDFLKRDLSEKSTRKIRKIKVKFTRNKKVKLPKNWKQAKTAFVEVYPPSYPAHFPTGFRLVHYIEGRKHVRVRENVQTEDCRAATAKLTKRDFQRSIKGEIR
jgi:hypothetical protein